MGIVDRILNIFTDVKKGEGAGALLLLLNIFLIMTSYYILKTTREALILTDEIGQLGNDLAVWMGSTGEDAGGAAEVKSYMAAAQAFVLMGAVPLYSWLTDKVDRDRLIWGVTLFFIVCMELFWGAARAEIPYLGIPFFIWVGIFSLAIIAQFWSYANDVYEKGQGERLFPMMAIGMTAGAAMGSKASTLLSDAGLGPYERLHVSAGLLLVSGVLYTLYNRTQAVADKTEESESESGDAADSGSGGFRLVLANPYIRWIALLFICLNLVNTTGEFILSDFVEAAAAQSGDEDFVNDFYGDFFFYVNIFAIALQALVVSRMVKFGGLALVIFALPVISTLTYGLAAGGAGLAIWQWAKTAENTTDYSVMNTAKALIWLPTSTEEKYKAKQAVDTFFVRLGDVLSAVVVWAGLHLLHLERSGFALVNLGVIALWFFVAYKVWRGYSAHDVDAKEAVA